MNNGFVFACNDFFFRGLLVTIKSLWKFNPLAKIEVLDTGLSNVQIMELRKRHIQVIDIKEKLQTHFHNKREWHSDFSVYGSLFIDESSFDNIIFCDSDLLILGDLSEYFNLIEKYKVVATKSNSVKSYFNPKYFIPLRKYITEEGQKDMNKQYDINWDYVTFNSGFWGIQKSYYKELKEAYWHLLEEMEAEFTFHDQTFINLVLCLDNKCFYDAGFGYNAVNIGALNSYSSSKGLIKYILYKFTQQAYRIKGLSVYYKGLGVKVLHWTGGNKPFLNNSGKIRGGGALLWQKFM